MRAGAGVDVAASAEKLFGLFDMISPLGEVAQSCAVLAGLAGAMPVHRLRRVCALSSKRFMCERRDVARPV
jgi:acetyl-CoA acetyltransferase